MYGNHVEEYLKAQEKCWFEGFDQFDKGGIIFLTGFGVSIKFDAIPNIRIENDTIKNIQTVFDFIIELDRYNRGARKQIAMNWTANFIKQLLK